MASVLNRKGNVVVNPPIIQRLFNDPMAGLLWLPLRIWLGLQWFQAVEHKLVDPKWTQTGEALKGFWLNAVKIPDTGRPAIAFDWYRDFLNMLLNAQAYTWFSKLVIAGELMVGICLIIGAFTGIAALFGAAMNWNFMMAGSASTNPMLFLVAVLLVAAWKVAGTFGADFFIVRWIGSLWPGIPQTQTVLPAVPRTEPNLAGTD